MDNIFPQFDNQHTCTIQKFSDFIKVLPDGDILEFGVASAQTTVEIASKNPERKLFAFDHFQGLEQTKKFIPDWIGWYEGAFRLGDPKHYDWLPKTLEEVLQRIEKYRNIELVIEDIHQLKHPSEYGIKKIVAANIDVDIYEPTVSSLNFIDLCEWDKLYIRFDDWHGHESIFDFHERLACREWLEKNKDYNYTIPENGHAGGVIVWR